MIKKSFELSHDLFNHQMNGFLLSIILSSMIVFIIDYFLYFCRSRVGVTKLEKTLSIIGKTLHSWKDVTT